MNFSLAKSIGRDLSIGVVSKHGFNGMGWRLVIDLKGVSSLDTTSCLEENRIISVVELRAEIVFGIGTEFTTGGAGREGAILMF